MSETKHCPWFRVAKNKWICTRKGVKQVFAIVILKKMMASLGDPGVSMQYGRTPLSSCLSPRWEAPTQKFVRKTVQLKPPVAQFLQQGQVGHLLSETMSVRCTCFFSWTFPNQPNEWPNKWTNQDSLCCGPHFVAESHAWPKTVERRGHSSHLSPLVGREHSDMLDVLLDVYLHVISLTSLRMFFPFGLHLKGSNWKPFVETWFIHEYGTLELSYDLIVRPHKWDDVCGTCMQCCTNQ